MQRFEYHVALLHHPETSAEVEKQKAKLDGLGSEGWELVAMTPASATHRAFYFKRPSRSK